MYACSLGPGPFRLRGAGGLRNPSRESRPGPEATVLHIAGQVDPRLTEFRPHYDSIDEPVRCCLPLALRKHVAPAQLLRKTRICFAKRYPASLLPTRPSGAIIVP